MAQSVQISMELWQLLLEFFITEEDPDQLHLIEYEINKQLEIKLDKMLSRIYYSRYKTAPSPEERERARQEYLNHKGIPADFRW